MSGELISQCARMWVYSHMPMGLAMYMMLKTCERKSNWRWGILFLESKILVNIFATEVMGFLCGETRGYHIFWSWYSIAITISGFWWSIYFFKGSFSKKALACFVADAFAMGVLMSAWSIIYRLQGVREIFVMSGEKLQKEDIGVVVVFVLLSFISIGVVKPALNWMYTYEVKRNGIVETVVAVWLVNAVCANLQAGNKSGTYSLTIGFLAGITGCLFLAAFWGKRVKFEKILYAEQKKFAETHLAMLQEQAVWVSENREQLKEQIQMVEAAERKNAGNQELIREYLEELKSRYEQFHAGVYCDDRMVDALLCCKEKVCRQQEIGTDFQLQKYERGIVEEQDMVKLLLNLLDYGIHSSMMAEATSGKETFTKTLSLQISNIRGQMFIEMECGGKETFKKAGVKPILKKYAGTVQQKKSENSLQTVQIMLGTR